MSMTVPEQKSGRASVSPGLSVYKRLLRSWGAAPGDDAAVIGNGARYLLDDSRHPTSATPSCDGFKSFEDRHRATNATKLSHFRTTIVGHTLTEGGAIDVTGTRYHALWRTGTVLEPSALRRNQVCRTRVQSTVPKVEETQ